MEYNLEKVVNHRISMVAVLMKRHVFKMLAEKELEVTPDQWVVLHYLWEDDGISIGEIAKRSKKDLANVTRIVEKLIKMKYVTKRKSKKDHRISNVYITQKANEIKADIQHCWKEASSVALNGIEEDEQEELMKTLTKIENNIMSKLENEGKSTINKT